MSLLDKMYKALIEPSLTKHMVLDGKERALTQPIKLCSVYEQERLAHDSLALHIIKKRIKKKPAGNRRIGLAEIEEIENSIKRELNNE